MFGPVLSLYMCLFDLPSLRASFQEVKAIAQMFLKQPLICRNIYISNHLKTTESRPSRPQKNYMNILNAHVGLIVIAIF
jgi:hypothetical protein